MKTRFSNSAVALMVGAALAIGTAGPAQAQKKGGILKFVVAGEAPSWDGHRETTFANVHPIAPFYSVLIRVDPNDPASTNFVCDLCTEMPKPTNDGKTYTFKIRKGVKFHDGSALTSADIVETYKKLIFPPADVASARKAFYVMVDSVTAPDDHTVVFELKYPSGAFIPALANPFNYVYSAKKLGQDMHWFEKNVMGSGPFMFDSYEAGAVIRGKKNPNYYHAGKPYLDGFEAIFASKQSIRVQAIQGDRAAIEFRGFPPKSRDDLKKALGKDLTVQESPWNCVLLATFNHKKKPFDDVRVRKALTLAVDRWGGSEYLSTIAIVKPVGGVAFPGHPLAATKAELQKIPGYWPDIKKSREEARRLLKEAGVSNLSFSLNNRGVDQPYKIVGTWLIDQWRQVGVTVKQETKPTGPFYDSLRKKKDYDMSMDFNCQAVVNPLLDVAKFVSDDKTGNQYGNYQDRELDKMFDQMNQEADPMKQRAIMRKFEARSLGENVNAMITLWWNRIIPHRSYVKGWKVSPSHYLNQDLSGVWLDK